MGHNRKVMIIDDNLIDQMITAYILKTNLAYTDILVMNSARLAFEYLKLNQDNLAAIPCKILLDLDMPDMNGFEFMESFITLAAKVIENCEVIVLTGSDIEEDLKLIAAHPNVAKLIAKPIIKSQFLPII